MKQTSVEWLINQLGKSGFDFSSHQGNIQQAKEIEKQQQGYSEREVLEILEDYDREFKLDTFAYTNPCSFTVKEWFEKFKNK
jgi:hypothetical protein